MSTSVGGGFMSGCTHRTESGAYVRVNTISASMQLERRGCLRPCVRPAGARVGCWELVTVFSVSQRLCFWFAPSPCRSAPARAAPRDGDTREGMFGVPGIAARTWARPRRARDPPCAVFTFAPSKPRGRGGRARQRRGHAEYTSVRTPEHGCARRVRSGVRAAAQRLKKRRAGAGVQKQN
jgi:hypothetical protein